MRTFIILISVSIFFIGCSFKKEPVYKTKLVVKYESIPKHLLLDDVVLPTPYNRETYIKASPIDRDILNTKLIVELYSTIGKYKLKLQAIRKFDDNVSNLKK